MGSCFTIHRNNETTATTDMKVKPSSSGSKTVNFVNSPSPVKENPKNRSLDWSTPQSNITANGSKDEAFFDSKALDSDCEDEFYSVNEDLTPSRCNTPIHNTFGTPDHNKNPFSVNRIQGCMHVPSPEKKVRKKLVDFFRESIEDDQDGGIKEAKPTIQDALPQSDLSTPISRSNSAWSSERTTSEDTVSTRESSVKSVKSVKSPRWCLSIPDLSPDLSPRRSFRERIRKVKSWNSRENKESQVLE